MESIYLLTDGKPDNSTSLVLREVAELNTDRSVVINAISFNCHDRSVLFLFITTLRFMTCRW